MEYLETIHTEVKNLKPVSISWSSYIESKYLRQLIEFKC